MINMFKIIEISEINEEIKKFLKEQWAKADLEHFGKVISWEKIIKKFQATENGELVGILEIIIQAGVCHIDEIIIKENYQSKGLGTKLMQKAEEIAKEYNCHKLYLETGKTWKATKFYEKLGYIKTGDLQNHLANTAYVIYTKFL